MFRLIHSAFDKAESIFKEDPDSDDLCVIHIRDLRIAEVKMLSSCFKTKFLVDVEAGFCYIEYYFFEGKKIIIKARSALFPEIIIQALKPVNCMEESKAYYRFQMIKCDSKVPVGPMFLQNYFGREALSYADKFN